MPINFLLLMAELIMCPSTGTDQNIIKIAINPAKFLPINGAKKINSSTKIMVINEPHPIIALIVCSIRRL